MRSASNFFVSIFSSLITRRLLSPPTDYRPLPITRFHSPFWGPTAAVGK